jgi:hypothetical protein
VQVYRNKYALTINYSYNIALLSSIASKLGNLLHEVCIKRKDIFIIFLNRLDEFSSPLVVLEFKSAPSQVKPIKPGIYLDRN